MTTTQTPGGRVAAWGRGQRPTVRLALRRFAADYITDVRDRLPSVPTNVAAFVITLLAVRGVAVLLGIV